MSRSVRTTKLSRRTLTKALATGVGVAATPAITNAAPSRKYSPMAFKQTKKLVPLFTVENDPASLQFYDDTIRMFNEEVDPDVEIEVSVYQDENVLQFVGTAFQTGTDLGVFSSFGSQISTWANAGYLLPLDTIVESVGEDDFLPGTRMVVDGHDYIMPAQANASGLWVRTDLLADAGLDIPETYEDFIGALEELDGRDGVVGISTGVGMVPNLTTQFYSPYIYQSGWDFHSPQGDVTFGEADVLESVKRFSNVLSYSSPSLYNATYPDIMNLFAAGRAAFATFPGRLGVNVSANAPEIAENMTVIPIPAGPFMPTELHFGGASPFSVHAETAHPEEAKAFLQYMLTGERLLAFAMTVPGHLLPPLYSVRDMIPDYESEYMNEHRDWVMQLNDMVPQAMGPNANMGSVHNHEFTEKLNNPCPWGAQIWDTDPVDGRMFQRIMIQGDDPELAWSDAVDEITAIRESWLADNPDWEPAF